MKPTCYFSYCWDDDTRLIEYIKEQVETMSDNRIEVIFDRNSFETGDDIDTVESRILSSDTVVVFASPNYRKILDNSEEHRGVYREYTKYILPVLDSTPDMIIPVIYTGGKSTSVPRELHKKIHSDISCITATKTKGKTKIDKEYESVVKQLVRFIIKQTDSMHRMRPVYENNLSENEKVRSLLQVHEADNKLPQSCMVSMDVYDKILNQSSYFVIGRKGSGKSTLLEVLEKWEPRAFVNKYKALFPMSAEHIELETLYSLLKTNVDEDLLSNGLVLQVFWEFYIVMHAIVGVCIEDENCHIQDERHQIFESVGKYIKSKLGIQKLGYGITQEGLFALCAELISDFLRSEVIDYATQDAFLSSIRVNFNSYNVLRSFLKNRKTTQICRAISKCKKRILISLDGFDTHSDDFRMRTKQLLDKPDTQSEAQNRIHFESLFYRSLFDQVRKIKATRNSSPINQITNLLDFCIVLPKDRLEQIETIDRDFSKKCFTYLRWDAIELLKMMVLRLEYIGNIQHSVDYNYSMLDRFEFAMQKLAPEIPLEIAIDINGQTRYLDLFQYVLRASFWNPRDIIKHFDCLLNAARNAREDQTKTNLIPSSTIKELLHGVSKTIIDREFIIEYRQVFYNIKDILQAFSNCNLLMDREELYCKLSQYDFKTCVQYSCKKTEDKLKILYEIGMIGLVFTPADANRYGFGSDTCFIFNEGLFPLNTYNIMPLEIQKKCKFMLSPILIKYLFLQINTNNIVGDWGWKYHDSNHQKKSSISNY